VRLGLNVHFVLNVLRLQTNETRRIRLAPILLTAIAMGAKRVEDLIVWQLANELKIKVYDLTETGPASKDLKFRDDLRDAASSTTKEHRGRIRKISPQRICAVSPPFERLVIRDLGRTSRRRGPEILDR